MADQSTEVFPKHREIPLYKKYTLFSTSILVKWASDVLFSLFLAEIWYIASLQDLEKSDARIFHFCVFRRFMTLQKCKKAWFLQKMGIFGLFDPVKRQKTQK